MKIPFVLAFGLLIGLRCVVPEPAHAQETDRLYLEHVRSRLFREAASLEQQNYKAAQAAVIEVTERAQIRRFVLRLEQGVQYAFIASCDQDCSHVALALIDGQRNVIAKTPETSDLVILGGAPPASGLYEAEITIPGCRERSCHTGFAIMSLGDAHSAGPIIVARGDSGLPKVAGFTQFRMERKMGYEAEANNFRAAQVGNLDECERLCVNDTRCVAVEFYRQKSSCGFFSKVPTLKRAQGVDSAIKRTSDR
jgi:PAN domain